MSGTQTTNLLVCLNDKKSIHLYINKELHLSIDYILDITLGIRIQSCHQQLALKHVQQASTDLRSEASSFWAG